MNGTDPPGRRIRTIEESSNNQSSGHRNVKKHLRSIGLSFSRQKEQGRPPSISRFTRKSRALYA